MVHVSGDSCRITGIVDWDRLNLAPAAFAFQNPCWLWCGGSCDYGCQPLNLKDFNVKKAFLDEAGELVSTYCNDPDKYPAKDIWLWSNTDFDFISHEDHHRGVRSRCGKLGR